MKSRFSKISVLILSFIILSSTFVMADGFTDIEDSQYKDEINYLIEKEIIHGYEDNSFKPENKITRGEFAKILMDALELEIDPENAVQFKDVQGKWYQGYIGAIYKQGLMVGIADDEFAPESNITKEELSVILIRAFELEYALEDLEVVTDAADINNLPDWSKKSVFLSKAIGLMETVEVEDVTMFLPKELANREYVSKLIYELLVKKDSYDGAINDLIEKIKSEEIIKEKDEVKKEEDKKENTGKKEEAKEKEINTKEFVLGSWKTTYSGIAAEIDFKKDNTCHVKASIASANGTYTISDDNIMTVKLMGREKTGKILVESKDKFEIVNSGGSNMVFTRD